jgi:hypothetical protein
MTFIFYRNILQEQKQGTKLQPSKKHAVLSMMILLLILRKFASWPRHLLSGQLPRSPHPSSTFDHIK